MIAWFFTGATAALIFPHVVYPPVLYLVSRLRRPIVPGEAKPSVTLIISAFNEAGIIRQKLQNALSLNYPSDLLEILVISDASDDGTDDIVREYISENVRLCRQEPRRGKSAGLTRFCPEAQGEILVFTDANSMFDPDALAKLVRHFDCPAVGYAVGRQLYEISKRNPSADSESVYWSMELMLKEWESRLSSVVGADGAIYGLRKCLFEPLSNEDINDFVLPLKVVARGYRGVFEPDAVCYEAAAPNFNGEFRRKYRIVNRSFRAVTKVPQAFNPFRVGWFAFQLVSHKVLRWLGPVFLLTMLVSSAWLSYGELTDGQRAGLYTALACSQLTGYLLAAAYILPPCRRIRLVGLAYYFLLVNIAAAVGLGLLLSGRTIGIWKPQR